MAERTSDWELVNAEPAVYRHRGRGSLWVVGQELLYVPGATLSDVIALKKSVDEIGKPPPAEPVEVGSCGTARFSALDHTGYVAHHAA